MKTRRMLWVWLVLSLVPSVSFGADRMDVPPGRPFQALLDRISVLEGQVNALQAAGSAYAVYDSTGRKVGTVIGTAEVNIFPFIANYNTTVYKYPVVVIEYNHKLIILVATRNSFFSFNQVLTYTTPDCTGQAYATIDTLSSGAVITVILLSPLPIVAVPLEGSTVYVESGAPVSASDTAFLSHKIRADECLPGSALSSIMYPAYVPVDPLVDLNSLFTPPFQVRK